MAKHAIVIGAGVAGLATAGLLAREGYHVRVFEKLDAPGGRAGQLTDSGFRWDTGPSWYLMPEAYDRFFKLMGTTTEQAYELVDLHPAYRLFPEGSPTLDVDSGVGNVATLFDALDPGAGKKYNATSATPPTCTTSPCDTSSTPLLATPATSCAPTSFADSPTLRDS